MTVTLYSTSSSANTVTKVLSDEMTVTGGNAFRTDDSPSDRNPTITILAARETLNSYNYVYIADFAAYYFIRDRIAVTAQTTKLILKKDVLFTYADGIKSNRGMIVRQAEEEHSDVDLDDEALVVKRSELQALTLSNYGDHTPKIILAVTGVTGD